MPLIRTERMRERKVKKTTSISNLLSSCCELNNTWHTYLDFNWSAQFWGFVLFPPHVLNKKISFIKRASRFYSWLAEWWVTGDQAWQSEFKSPGTHLSALSSSDSQVHLRTAAREEDNCAPCQSIDRSIDRDVQILWKGRKCLCWGNKTPALHWGLFASIGGALGHSRLPGML